MFIAFAVVAFDVVFLLCRRRDNCGKDGWGERVALDNFHKVLSQDLRLKRYVLVQDDRL